MGLTRILGISGKGKKEGVQEHQLMGKGKQASVIKHGKIYIEFQHFNDLGQA